MARGYTMRVCMGCGRDALLPTRGTKNTPLCGECVHAHDETDDGEEAYETLGVDPAKRRRVNHISDFEKGGE